MENQQQTTTLCRAGCGFFGSPSTEGLCSKCYKDYVKRKQDTTARVSPPLSAVVSSGTNTVTATSSAVSSTTCNGDNTAATSSTVMIAEKLREVSCSQAAKSSEDMTAQLESVAAAVEAAGGITASSSGTCSGVLSTSRITGLQGSGLKGLTPSNIIADHMTSGCVLGLVSVVSSVASLDAAAGSETALLNNEGQPVPKKANRCHVCKKRVGLTGFVCRCGGLYCGEHRYDTAHGCSFDYKTMEREEIRKNNPVIVSEKIQRI
uniref:AN1-type domain-containing protein n=1 Tax=Setaria digitata TaxID=48799 RepID=A0A915Q6R0_9BILA